MKIAVLGATGTLGAELIRQLLINYPKAEIIAFSRCELKQKELANRFPSIKCVIGDIRDRDSLRSALVGVLLVYHVAALKHIEIMEQNPEESVKTNILGTINVCSVAKELGIKNVLFSSTDKAVNPINVYGMCKGISEKIMLNNGFIVFRWGNVLGSRGSALHYFIEQIKNHRPVNITDMQMTRFWITIENAVEFMLSVPFSSSRVYIPEMKAAKVTGIIRAIGNIYNKTPTLTETWLRPGEKIHESISADLNSKNAPQFTSKELIEILRPYCT